MRSVDFLVAPLYVDFCFNFSGFVGRLLRSFLALLNLGWRLCRMRELGVEFFRRANIVGVLAALR